MSGAEDYVDNSDWYAYVKYKANKKFEYVSILFIERKIGCTKKVLFNSKTLSDFDDKKLYSVKTFQDSSDRSAHRYYAVIGKLGESLESLQNEVVTGRRIIWPVVEDNDSEPLSTAAEDALERDTVNPAVVSTREDIKIKKKQKKNAADLIHGRLLQNVDKSILSDSSNHSAARIVSDTAKISAAESNLDDEVAMLKAELKKRDAKLKELEQSLLSTSEPVFQNITLRLEQLTKAIENQIRDSEKRFAELEKRVDEYFSKFPYCAPLHVINWVCKWMKVGY